MQAIEPVDKPDSIASFRGPDRQPWYRGKPLRRLQGLVGAVVHDHPHRNLFITAMPKSGSTWLARMVASIPGYREWAPPYITETDHTLHAESLRQPPVGYTVTKLHSRPTPEHLALLNGLQRPYVILFRDLRDAAVSGYFFLRGVYEHESAAAYRGLNAEEGIARWMDEKLAERVQWIDGWLAGRDVKWGLVVRYEDLLRDPLDGFHGICDHFEVNLSASQLRKIVERHSFQRATGRAPGQTDEKSFNRKGIAGDWVNHFTPALKEKFKSIAGDALVRFGYEKNNDW